MDHEEKVTFMVLNVDLECSKCYNKVKKLLCKFPQVRDQMYDEKANKVLIKVVCCSPEKIRDKICSKGGGSIKGIEIKKPDQKPKAPAATPNKEDQDKIKKKTDQDHPNTKKAGAGAPGAPAPGAPAPSAGKPAQEHPKVPKQQQMIMGPPPVPMFYPPPPPHMGGGGGAGYYATGVPAGQFYGGGGHGGVVHYDGYYGRPVYDSWSGYDNNDQPCSIM